MKECLISLVIPVYNQKRSRLERCINSVCRQSYQHFEVIVVDDGSSDECLEIEKAICGRDQRIRIIKQNNEGSGSARNNGVRNSYGDYVMFLDSDDMLADYALEDAVTYINNNGFVDMIVGQVHKEIEMEDHSFSFQRETTGYISLGGGTQRIYKPYNGLSK